MTKNSTKIICIIQNKNDESLLSNYGMKSLTFNEVKESGVKQKFYSYHRFIINPPAIKSSPS